MWKEEARGSYKGKDEQCASVGMRAPTRLADGQGVPEETVENVECVEEGVDKRGNGKESSNFALNAGNC